MTDIETKLGERKRVKNVFEELNLGLLIHVIYSSLLYVLIFIIITTTLAFAYLRWTPDVFETNAVLMAKSSKQTELLGLESLLKDDANEIKLEIQLLRSKLIVKRAIDSLNLNVQYFSKGRFLNTENYTTNPFYVKFNILNQNFENNNIYINFLNDKEYQLSYIENDEEVVEKILIGAKFTNKLFSLELFMQPNLKGSMYTEESFFFKYRNTNSIVDEIVSGLQVFPVMSNSKTLTINYQSTNKIKAKMLIEAICDEFIQYDKEKKAESINNIISFLQKQIEIYGNEYNIFQDSVNNIRIANGFIQPEMQIESNIEQIENIDIRLSELDYSLRTIGYLENFLNSKSSISSISKEILIGELNLFAPEINEIATKEKLKEIQLLDVTEDHPSIQQLDNEINLLKLNLKAQINLIKIKNRDTKTNILKERKEKYAELYDIPGKEMVYDRLINENEIRESFLNNMIDKRSNYLIAKAGIVSDYIYLQKAAIEKKPISPNRSFIKIAGLLLGFVLGLLFIALRYLTHNRIISLNEIESNCNANILGMIPTFNTDNEHSQVVVTQNPKSSISESFRALRTNLEFLTESEGSKIITTTSTVPGEGKTFVGLNLASIFSLLDKKVVIVDFDLRKPRIAKSFNVENQKGTSTILIGKTPISDCIVKSGIPNLDFIPSGPVPPNPAELISKKITIEFLNELKKEYDYVFLDTPPIGLVTDSLSLLKLADYPIYVVRADYSKRSFLDNVNKILFDNQVTKLSVVLNDFGRGASSSVYKYGNGYGYGYGYGYGQGYYSDDIDQKLNIFSKIKNLFKK